MKLDILVAEDDPNTRAALCEILCDQGHAVTAAADGKAAEFHFKQSPPHLACLDVMMPGKSGFDLCKLFRAAKPDMAILFITAKAEEIDKVVGLELGADDYIVKPFGAKEVIARVRAVARRCVKGFVDNADQQSNILPDGDFSMNGLRIKPKRMQAIRSSNTIPLTMKELKILQLLFAREGEVVARQQIFDVAWTDGSPPTTRTLDQTVSQLRKRIEIDPKHPTIITTVYGVGYRFEANPTLQQNGDCND